MQYSEGKCECSILFEYLVLLTEISWKGSEARQRIGGMRLANAETFGAYFILSYVCLVPK